MADLQDKNPGSDGSTQGSKTIAEIRTSIAKAMVQVACDTPIPQALRTKLWLLSTRVSQRSPDEIALIDAMCALMHLAHAKGIDPKSTMLAAQIHFDREIVPGQPQAQADTSIAGGGSTGERLVIHCLDDGCFWNAEKGEWIDDLLGATTFAPGAEAEIDMPGGNCDLAEVAHIKDLIEVKHWHDAK